MNTHWTKSCWYKREGAGAGAHQGDDEEAVEGMQEKNTLQWKATGKGAKANKATGKGAKENKATGKGAKVSKQSDQDSSSGQSWGQYTGKTADGNPKRDEGASDSASGRLADVVSAEAPVPAAPAAEKDEPGEPVTPGATTAVESASIAAASSGDARTAARSGDARTAASSADARTELELSRLTVEELQAALQSRGMDTEGNKYVLVKRVFKALADESAPTTGLTPQGTTEDERKDEPEAAKVEAEENEDAEANIRTVRMITTSSMARRAGQRKERTQGCFVVHEQVGTNASGGQPRSEQLVIDSCAYHNICSPGFAAEFPLLPVIQGQSASGPEQARGELVHCGVVVVDAIIDQEKHKTVTRNESFRAIIERESIPVTILFQVHPVAISGLGTNVLQEAGVGMMLYKNRGGELHLPDKREVELEFLNGMPTLNVIIQSKFDNYPERCQVMLAMAGLELYAESRISSHLGWPVETRFQRSIE